MSPWHRGFLRATAAVVALLGSAPPAAAEVPYLRSVRPATVELRPAALLMSGQEGGAIPLAAMALESPGAGAANVVAVVEVGAAPAGVEGAPAQAELEIYLYALRAGAGEEPEVLDLVSGVLRVERARLRGEGLTVLAPLRLPPGEHLLRVLVLDGDELGLRSAPVSVVGVAEAPPRFFIAVETAAERPRLAAWLDREAGTPAAVPPPFDRALPAVRPRLDGGESVRAYLLGAAGTREARARWRPAAARGREQETRLEPRSPMAEVAEVALPVPAAGGVWELTVALGEPPNERLSAPLRVEVEAAAGAVPISETVAARTSAADAEPPAPAIDPESLRSVAAAYGEVLRRLAADDGAWPALRALETGLVERLGATALGALEQAQLGSFRALEKGDWEAVLPVLRLHGDAVRRYRDVRRLDLSQHSTRVAAALAAAYAERLDTAEARREAAWAMVELADLYRRRGPLDQAEELFARALELDAGNERALLGLAALHEKRGRYAAAVELFERLVKLAPRHHEARLRLANNLYRRGEVERPWRLWSRLAKGSAPDWIALVARQELTRSQLDKGRLADAEEGLRHGLGRWPGHPTLTLQLARLHELRGDRATSRRLLRELQDANGRRHESARTRYNRWTDLDLPELRRELEARAERRRPRLAELAAANGEGG